MSAKGVSAMAWSGTSRPMPVPQTNIYLIYAYQWAKLGSLAVAGTSHVWPNYPECFPKINHQGALSDLYLPGRLSGASTAEEAVWAAANWQRYTLLTTLVEDPACGRLAGASVELLWTQDPDGWAAVRRHLWEVQYVPHWALEESPVS